jgi:Flp pilus assembly protein TadG
MRTWRRDDGQAAVELIALLPLVALLAAGAWQLAVAGHAAWSADAAARAAARAVATGGDARAAARASLPGRLEEGLKVTASEEGDVRVTLRIPPVAGLRVLSTVSASAHFRPQR